MAWPTAHVPGAHQAPHGPLNKRAFPKLVLNYTDKDALVDGGLDWVVVGGESGPGARPMDPDWARRLRDECAAASVPFFFKQWGGRSAKANGRELDGRTWDQYPRNGA
jgi:protein gp37